MVAAFSTRHGACSDVIVPEVVTRPWGPSQHGVVFPGIVVRFERFDGVILVKHRDD